MLIIIIINTKIIRPNVCLPLFYVSLATGVEVTDFVNYLTLSDVFDPELLPLCQNLDQTYRH